MEKTKTAEQTWVKVKADTDLAVCAWDGESWVPMHNVKPTEASAPLPPSPEGKTAEEVLRQHIGSVFIFTGSVKQEELTDYRNRILAAMEEYASQFTQPSLPVVQVKEVKDVLQGLVESFMPWHSAIISNRQYDALEDAKQLLKRLSIPTDKDQK